MYYGNVLSAMKKKKLLSRTKAYSYGENEAELLQILANIGRGRCQKKTKGHISM